MWSAAVFKARLPLLHCLKSSALLLTARVRRSCLVLLRIPSLRPNSQTFSQFVRVQILGFLAAENDGFETYVRKFFHLISEIYTTKTPSEWH